MKPENSDAREMRPEYDIRGGVRGKYAEQYREGVTTTIVVDLESTALVNITTSGLSSITFTNKIPVSPAIRLLSRKPQPANPVLDDLVYAGENPSRG